MTEDASIFDRRLLRLRRDRAAATLADHDFLFREIGERLADRLDDIARRFPCALELGCRDGGWASRLDGRGGIETLVQCDLSPAMAANAARRGAPALCADEEFLPFADASFDLVASNFNLHWVNDLPGCLIQIRRILKPDGLFLAAMPGGGTLGELRSSLTAAELEAEGGVSPRISPFVELRDAGALLQRAGFALPVVDCDTLTVTYPEALTLMRDLRAMGESNAIGAGRRSFTRRGTLFAAAAEYGRRWAQPDGRIPATFQILYLTAWAPHPSQQRALRPGSAKARLAEALGSIETTPGETTPGETTPGRGGAT
jgi:SAM-dependent methyltransferase